MGPFLLEVVAISSVNSPLRLPTPKPNLMAVRKHLGPKRKGKPREKRAKFRRNI